MPDRVTKRLFLDTYRAKLLEKYDWANDAGRLERFMASIEETLNGGNTWMREGEIYHATLKALGIPKRIPLKGLQALPNE